MEPAKVTTIRSNKLPSCMLSRIEVTLKMGSE